MVSVIRYFCSQQLLCVIALRDEVLLCLLSKAMNVGLFGIKYFLLNMISSDMWL